MSYDRQIDQVCPHEVVNEALFLESDRQTFRPLRPIASSIGIKVWFNGAFEVPITGVQLPGQVVGGTEGPFTIPAGSTTMTLSVNQGPSFTVTVKESVRRSPESVVAELQPQVQNKGLDLAVAQGRRIRMFTQDSGLHTSVQVLGTSPLASVLGYAVGREHRGQQRLSPWSLVRDPRTLSDRPLYLVIFDDPLRSEGDFIEITYTTVRQECRRCGGTGIENDWRYGRTGEVVRVRDSALLHQEFLKVLFTLKGTNPFHPGYGTRLLDVVGRKNIPGGVIQNLIAADIRTAFQQWQSVKRIQEEQVGQLVTDEEYPFRLLGVDVQSDLANPTILRVSVTIQSRSRNPLVIERGIVFPEPLNLLGQSQAQGVFRRSLTGPTLVG